MEAGGYSDLVVQLMSRQAVRLGSPCPDCKVGELVQRETKNSVMLECSRRGKRVTDRKCDFIQRYSKAEAEALEVAWDEWAALSKDTPSV